MPRKNKSDGTSRKEIERQEAWCKQRKMASRGFTLADLAGVDANSTHERLERMDAQAMSELIAIRIGYEGTWGAGAKYLYRQLIRAYKLQHRERELLALAESKPGRKIDLRQAQQIYQMTVEGMKAREIAEKLKISVEAVESYRKTRRIDALDR